MFISWCVRVLFMLDCVIYCCVSCCVCGVRVFLLVSRVAMVFWYVCACLLLFVCLYCLVFVVSLRYAFFVCL